MADRELGTWTLGPGSIELLDARVTASRPTVVLEFGSGVSTVCLAHMLRDSKPAARIITIEQDSAEIERTAGALSALPRSAAVTFLHAPLQRQAVLGRNVLTYRLPMDELQRQLAGDTIGFVLIDGPASEDGARLGTLPLVHECINDGAPVILDDALRDGELTAVEAWLAHGLIAVEGIAPVDHGLLVGSVRRLL